MDGKDEIKTVEDYLRKFAHISPILKFVLEHGRKFDLKPLPADVRPGRVKECFKNAYLGSIGGKYYYAEGYAAGIIPVLHAWLVDDEGNAYDPTWSPDIPGTDYYGVAFKRKYVLEAMLRSERHGILTTPPEAHHIIEVANLKEALVQFEKGGSNE